VSRKYSNGIVKKNKTTQSRYRNKLPPKTSFTALVFVTGNTANKIKSFFDTRKGKKASLYRKIFETGVATMIEKQKQK